MPVLGSICFPVSVMFSWSIYVCPGLFCGFAHACVSSGGGEAATPSCSSTTAKDLLSQRPHMVFYVASAVINQVTVSLLV